MIGKSTVLAIITARSGSKGLPGKNIRALNGAPLLTYPIKAAMECNYIDKVILSTDSQEYADIGIKAGAEVPFLRDESLAADKASSIDVVLDVIDKLEANGNQFDYIVLLEPTSPLTEGSDINSALESLMSVGDIEHAIVGVSLLETSHPAFAVKCEGQYIVPYNAKGFDKLPRRQDIEELYALDGSLYISSVKALRNHRSFCHAKTLPHVMPKYKSLEVDDIIDFVCIEAILKDLAFVKANSQNN